MEIITIDINTHHLLDDSVCAIGYFDGIHLGHQSLLDEVTKISKQTGLKKGIMTFSTQPKSFVRDTPFNYLSSLTEKILYLEELDFDYFFIVDFSEEIAKLEPESFINNMIIKNNIKHLVCGFDFKYGFKAMGDVNSLQKYDHNILDCTIVPALNIDNHKVSSSLIRDEIAQGNINYVNKLLGHPYYIIGKVIYGKQIGRQLGFPTANIDYLNHQLPKRGVYAVKVYIDDKIYNGMANIGVNPTVSSLDKKSLEVNIFDFDEDIYHKVIKVEFIKFIRDEVKFNGRDALINQLHSDKDNIRKLLD